MAFLKYSAICLLGLSALIILIFAIGSRRPVRYLLSNAALGILGLAAVELTARFTGVHIPINEWSASAAAGLGLPGVCGLLGLQLIFGV